MRRSWQLIVTNTCPRTRALYRFLMVIFLFFFYQKLIIKLLNKWIAEGKVSWRLLTYFTRPHPGSCLVTLRLFNEGQMLHPTEQCWKSTSQPRCESADAWVKNSPREANYTFKKFPRLPHGLSWEKGSRASSNEILAKSLIRFSENSRFSSWLPICFFVLFCFVPGQRSGTSA